MLSIIALSPLAWCGLFFQIAIIWFTLCAVIHETRSLTLEIQNACSAEQIAKAAGKKNLAWAALAASIILTIITNIDAYQSSNQIDSLTEKASPRAISATQRSLVAPTLKPVSNILVTVWWYKSHSTEPHKYAEAVTDLLVSRGFNARCKDWANISVRGYSPDIDEGITIAYLNDGDYAEHASQFKSALELLGQSVTMVPIVMSRTAYKSASEIKEEDKLWICIATKPTF